MTTKKKTKLGQRDEALAQFSADVDAFYGREVGFADTVRRLAGVKADIARVKKRRDELREEMKVRYKRGNFIAPARRREGGGYYLREVTIPGRAVRTVPADVVKKVDAGLWEAAKVRAARVAVVAPKGIELPSRGMKLPAAGAAVLRQLDFATVVDRYKSPDFDVLAELSVAENDLKVRLRVIAEQTDWEGEELIFADGWKAALWRMEYSADRLAVIAPEAYERLAVVRQTAPVTRIDVMDLALAEEKGYVDSGSYDGFAS